LLVALFGSRGFEVSDASVWKDRISLSSSSTTTTEIQVHRKKKES
jgi:hypothetical protein